MITLIRNLLNAFIVNERAVPNRYVRDIILGIYKGFVLIAAVTVFFFISLGIGTLLTSFIYEEHNNNIMFKTVVGICILANLMLIQTIIELNIIRRNRRRPTDINDKPHEQIRIPEPQWIKKRRGYKELSITSFEEY